MEHQRGHRVQGQLEVGIADATADDIGGYHVPAVHSVPLWLIRWEESRPRWLMEAIAEATGVFFYVYCGIAANVTFFLSSAAKETGFGSLFTIGLAYGIGVVCALVISATTSGGHLSPSYTIAFAVFRGFPWRKVPLYIFSQIFGAFMAALLIYAQFKSSLVAVTAELAALGPAGNAIIFSPNGPAGAFALFPAVGQPLGYGFLNEFVANIALAILVFAVIDPSNVFVRFTSVPFIIGLTYATFIWGLGTNTLILNTARDLGGRFVAAMFWGTAVFPTKFSALAALTNIPATLIGALFQIMFLSDTRRPFVNQQFPHGQELPHHEGATVTPAYVKNPNLHTARTLSGAHDGGVVRRSRTNEKGDRDSSTVERSV